MTRRLLTLCGLSVVAVLGIARFTVKGAGTDERLKDEIIKVSDEREQALGRGDIAALDQIDADDMVYTNWRGVSLTKAEHLADIKARNISFQTDFKHTEVQVVVHGNTGIVTGSSATNVVYKGNAVGGSRKFVNVFVKEGGRWRCVVHFEAPIAK
jgi:ketosteroid isomerase-like protein